MDIEEQIEKIDEKLEIYKHCTGAVWNHSNGDNLLIYKVRSSYDGSIAYKPFCKLCGRSGQAFSKGKLPPIGNHLIDNTELHTTESWVLENKDQIAQDKKTKIDKLWDEKIELQNKKTEQANKIWWDEYNAYLDTPKWQRLRQLVIKRDVVCQGCLERPIEQIHHLNYKRVGNELLFDLIGLCKNCHAKCHPTEYERQAHTSEVPL